MAADAFSNATLDSGGVLWRVLGFGRQQVPPNSSYWFDNRTRRPQGVVYCQYSVAGAISLITPDGERTVPAGHFVLFRHGEASSYGRREVGHHGSAYACEWVGLMGAGLDAHWDIARARYGAVLPPDAGLRQALNRLIDAAQPRAGAGPLAVGAAVHAFVTHLFSVSEARLARARTPVEAALDALIADPCRIGTLSALARTHGCSREHLARAFRARMGLSPAAWLTRARLERAIVLLRGSALPVAAVAEQSGFPSAHTLARQVKRATGQPPEAYRRS